MRWQRVLKWLYPGMGVKRWALLIGAGALLLVMPWSDSSQADSADESPAAC